MVQSISGNAASICSTPFSSYVLLPVRCHAPEWVTGLVLALDSLVANQQCLLSLRCGSVRVFDDHAYRVGNRFSCCYGFVDVTCEHQLAVVGTGHPDASEAVSDQLDVRPRESGQLLVGLGVVLQRDFVLN